jgi:signal transduction histidine kinase/HAMP domain-containing protein
VLVQYGDVLTHVAPIFGPDGRTPRFISYIEIGNSGAVEQKATITQLFVLGTLGAVVATSLAIFLMFNYTVLRRIFHTVGILKQVEEGNLAARIEGKLPGDEIGTLQQSVNSMAARLADLVNNLEQRVVARTRDIEVAASASARIASLKHQDELLQDIVELTHESFDLYQVSIFLFDDRSNQFALASASGGGSQPMLADKKNFDLDAQGLVPRAGATRQPVLENDVRNSQYHAANPYLPETQSELSIPIVAGDTLIGVLDLQSRSKDRFSTDDLRAMGLLAEQIGVAVENARLYARQGELIENLRAADQMKSQFLASMSHELRTPLNSILTFSDLMATGTFGEVNEEQTDYLHKILFSGRHLLALINDVLDISKMESGMMKLFIEDDFDVAKEVQQVSATVEKMIGDKEVELILDVDAEFPLLSVDKRRVRQVLLNILSNAVKFAQEGTITLSVKKKEHEILFAVIDTGPGIREDQQELIFEPFVQTETGIKHAGGTGLGLPISKRLVEAHGGRLWLESAPGQGAAFYFTIPLASPARLGEVTMQVVS